MTECLFADGKILACGNGGSAADAQHFAPSSSAASSASGPNCRHFARTDSSLLTAIANDYAFEQVFAKQVRRLGARVTSCLRSRRPEFGQRDCGDRRGRTAEMRIVALTPPARGRARW